MRCSSDSDIITMHWPGNRSMDRKSTLVYRKSLSLFQQNPLSGQLIWLQVFQTSSPPHRLGWCKNESCYNPPASLLPLAPFPTTPKDAFLSWEIIQTPGPTAAGLDGDWIKNEASDSWPGRRGTPWEQDLVATFASMALQSLVGHLLGFGLGWPQKQMTDAL